MGGSLTSTDAWFQNPASAVSAHFGVGLNGAIHQYVDLNSSAWANGILEPGNQWGRVDPHMSNPNLCTFSIETEDNGSGTTPVSNAQYSSVLSIVRLILSKTSGIHYLLRHTDISPQSRAHCPGDRWVASGRFQALADATGLRTL